MLSSQEPFPTSQVPPWAASTSVYRNSWSHTLYLIRKSLPRWTLKPAGQGRGLPPSNTSNRTLNTLCFLLILLLPERNCYRVMSTAQVSPLCILTPRGNVTSFLQLETPILRDGKESWDSLTENSQALEALHQDQPTSKVPKALRCVSESLRSLHTYSPSHENSIFYQGSGYF